MSTRKFSSRHLVGKKHLIGASSVTVSVDWEASVESDLSVIGSRKADYVRLAFPGVNTIAIASGDGIEFTVEQAIAIRDLLTNAIGSTMPADDTHPATP